MFVGDDDQIQRPAADLEDVRDDGVHPFRPLLGSLQNAAIDQDVAALLIRPGDD